MVKVDVPFTDQDIDTNDPTGSALGYLKFLVGMVLFFVGIAYARAGGNKATAWLDSLLDTNASGENSGELFGSPE